MSGSGIRWAICKSVPRSRQITTPAPHHSVFTGRMPFLLPNQRRQSTEGTRYKITGIRLIGVRVHICTRTQSVVWQLKSTKTSYLSRDVFHSLLFQTLFIYSNLFWRSTVNKGIVQQLRKQHHYELWAWNRQTDRQTDCSTA